MKQYLLFDLDGTLTDPKVGITTCVQYALQSFGIDEPDLDKLTPFIGPPLKESFMEFYNMSPEQAEAAVEKYRERFKDTGIFENRLYEGIPEMLKALNAKGMHLAVASSKPEVFVKRILEHFNILKYFKVIVGSELDGTRSNKDEVVAEALHRLFGDMEIERDKVFMIGDRRFDVEGARAMGVESVGVTYGYGSLEELKGAKADYVVRSVEELRKFLLRGTEEGKKPRTSFQIIWQMLFPFLLFMLFRQITLQILYLLLGIIEPVLPEAVARFFVILNEDGLRQATGNTDTIFSALAFVAGAIAIRRQAKEMILWAQEDMKLTHLKGEPAKNYFLLFTATVGAVIGVNLLFELLDVKLLSNTYQNVVQNQYSAVFGVGLICYGLLTPIAEEVLFRGIIFNCMKRFMKPKFAVILSAFCFGSYHMNSIQGAYGFIIGCLMAYGYVYFGSFYVPVAIHMVVNLLAYVLSNTGIAVSGFINWPVCVVFLILGIGSVLLLAKEKRVL